MRMAFNVPRNTRKYFIEELSELPHPQVMLAKRFLRFHENLQKSKKLGVRFLSVVSAANMMTVYGQNLWYIQRQCGEDVTSRGVGSKMKYAPVPEEDI